MPSFWRNTGDRKGSHFSHSACRNIGLSGWLIDCDGKIRRTSNFKQNAGLRLEESHFMS